MGASGCTIAFNKGDDNGPVIKDDFQSANGPNSVQVFWFSGHGGSGNVALKNFFWVLPPYTDCVMYWDVSWGGSLKWVFLHACQTLGSEAPQGNYVKQYSRFANSLNGVHLICGAASDMTTWPWDGSNVATRLTGQGTPVQTVKNSWFNGIAAWTGNNGVVLRVIAEDESYGNDYLPGEGTGPVPDIAVDAMYHSWSYQCQ